MSAAPKAKPGARREQIVAAARELLEAEGREGLSMRRLAERLGIRAPSLYAHFEGKADLEAMLISAGFEEWAAISAVAVEGDEAPLAALAAAYRAFATAHPHMYRLMTEQPLLRQLLSPGSEDRAAAPLVEAIGDEDRARAFWSFLHGMAINELNGRFPPDADLGAAYRAGVAAFSGAPE